MLRQDKKYKRNIYGNTGTHKTNIIVKPSPLSKKEILHNVEKRIYVVYIFIALGLAILIVHIYNLQLVHGHKYLLISKNNYIKTIPTPPIRGNIFDSNGIPLTQSIKGYSLFISPTSTNRAKKIFFQLENKIYLTDKDWSRYQRLKKSSHPLEDIVIKANLNQTDLAVLSILKNEIPEIYVGTTYNRNYPYSSFFTHVIGYTGNISTNDLNYINQNKFRQSNYVGTQKIGKIGLEKYYEEELHGSSGYSEVEVNSRGQPQRTINKIPAIDGKNIHTFLDLPTQIFIAKTIAHEKAVVVASDPSSGNIIAMYSNPSYDPNLFVNYISNEDYQTILNNSDRPLINRATIGIYPPGSTIKPFMAISGLNTGFITASTTITDPGFWLLPNSKQIYRDWLRSGHGQVNLHKSIVESVDTYYYDLSYKMGINTIHEEMSNFGFGKSPKIDLSESEISSGNLPSADWKYKKFNQKWVAGDTPPVGIGQGYFTATPLQLLQSLNILLNNGQNNGLHLAQNSIRQPEIFKLNNPNYWTVVKNAMGGVNSERNGSGYRSFLDAKYTSGGKTGTAQVFSLNGSNYKSNELNKKLHDHALYIGFAPFENPKISVVVIVENGGGGAKIAAPIARQVMDFYLNQRLPVINNHNLSQQDKINIALELTDQLIYNDDLKTIKINESDQD